MSGNFKPGTYVINKSTKELFIIIGIDWQTLNRKDKGIVLENTEGIRWTYFASELPLKFNIVENQNTALILYGDKNRGIK